MLEREADEIDWMVDQLQDVLAHAPGSGTPQPQLRGGGLCVSFDRVGVGLQLSRFDLVR
jgi:hypothetical protein